MPVRKARDAAGGASLRRIDPDLSEMFGPHFLNRAEHDMLSPVRMIKSLPDWVRDDLAEAGLKPPPPVEQSLESIVLLGWRIDRMVRDFIALERLRQHIPALVPLDPVARLQSLAEDVLNPSGHSILIGNSKGQIETDPDLFDQVFGALLDNAAKHHDRNPGHIEAVVEDGGYRITILDDGPGIDPAQLERIFRPFEMLQSRDKREGSGLGLSRVLRAADLLGGSVEIGAGFDGRGTAVRVTLGA